MCMKNDVQYKDRNGKDITEGCTLMIEGKPCKVYKTDEGDLGIDATNPRWIENGMAVEGEYGLYPLSTLDLSDVEVLDI